MPEFIQEPEKVQEPQATAKKVSRRQMLMTFGVALNAVAGVLFAIPVVGYIFGPSRRKEMKKELAWVTLGSLTQFPEGETRLATPATFLAGCAGFRRTNSRFSPSTARTWAARCAGFLNPDCSCAHAMAG